MRLSCYPHPTEGLYISEGELYLALKEGEATLCCYGIDPIIDVEITVWRYLRKSFERLIWHNGRRLREIVARECKWLALSLLWCWLPLRHWLEPRTWVMYRGIILVAFAMIMLTLADLLLQFKKLKQLPVLFQNFKISSIRRFPARPRSPVSDVRGTQNNANAPNIKFWAGFLIICIIISSIVPVSSTWVVVHPLGGKDYVVEGPALIRPFSSWRTVPKTCEVTSWTLLRLDGKTVWVFELQVEFTVEDPLEYKPKEWHLILDRALGIYFYNIMENMTSDLASQYPEMSVAEHEKMAVEFIAIYTSQIVEVIEKQLGSPMPMRVLSAKVRSVSMNEYSLYYQKTRRR